MDAAIARLVRAIREGEKIVVFGDYDVDGATSSALLARFFRAVGGNVAVYIPDRRKEGYGPNTPALLGIKEQGAAVVITVDCGITAFEPLAEARRVGLDLIVIDHHMAEIALPQAVAVVDPNRLDDEQPAQTDGGGGRGFPAGGRRQSRAARGRLVRQRAQRARPASMARPRRLRDCVRCRAADRRQPGPGAPGPARDGRPQQLGLAALADVARLREPPGAYHLGFMLGPRVNAGGRVGQADLGARLLSSDPEEVGALRSGSTSSTRSAAPSSARCWTGDHAHRGALRSRPQGLPSALVVRAKAGMSG